MVEMASQAIGLLYTLEKGQEHLRKLYVKCMHHGVPDAVQITCK